jgi:hypothetical protein
MTRHNIHLRQQLITQITRCIDVPRAIAGGRERKESLILITWVLRGFGLVCEGSGKYKSDLMSQIMPRIIKMALVTSYPLCP